MVTSLRFKLLNLWWEFLFCWLILVSGWLICLCGFIALRKPWIWVVVVLVLLLGCLFSFLMVWCSLILFVLYLFCCVLIVLLCCWLGGWFCLVVVYWLMALGVYVLCFDCCFWCLVWCGLSTCVCWWLVFGVFLGVWVLGFVGFGIVGLGVVWVCLFVFIAWCLVALLFCGFGCVCWFGLCGWLCTWVLDLFDCLSLRVDFGLCIL